ncbi:MAG: helix-turn-helix transcriptional regulator [Coriobacteriales bacterium]|nr:helix-turn-helix transcriptional regulator [Coriobacteriales bacterium]
MNKQAYSKQFKELGQNMKYIRKARGLTQEQAAELVELERVTVGYYEQGRRTPRLVTLYTFAKAYNVDISAFFSRDILLEELKKNQEQSKAEKP